MRLLNEVLQRMFHFSCIGVSFQGETLKEIGTAANGVPKKLENFPFPLEPEKLNHPGE